MANLPPETCPHPGCDADYYFSEPVSCDEEGCVCLRVKCFMGHTWLEYYTYRNLNLAENKDGR